MHVKADTVDLCRRAVLKGTHRGRPSKQIWPGQKLTSILRWPNRFDTHKLLFKARDSSPPTQKARNDMLFRVKP